MTTCSVRRFAFGLFTVCLLALLAGCQTGDPVLSAAYEPLPDQPLVINDANGYPQPNIPSKEIDGRSEARLARVRVLKKSVEDLTDEMNDSLSSRLITDSLVEDMVQLQSRLIEDLEELVRLHRAEEADLRLTVQCFDAGAAAVIQKVKELEASGEDEVVVDHLRSEEQLFRHLSVSYSGMAMIRCALAESFQQHLDKMNEQRKELQAKSG